MTWEHLFLILLSHFVMLVVGFTVGYTWWPAELKKHRGRMLRRYRPGVEAFAEVERRYRENERARERERLH